MRAAEARVLVEASPPGAVEEAELWRRLTDYRSPQARECLFLRHQAFARQMAAARFKRDRFSDLDFNDLRQIATTGLLEAIDRFDPSRGAPFRAYAAKVISGRLAEGVAQSSEVRRQVSVRAQIRRDRARSLRETDGRSDVLSAFIDLAVGLALGFMLEDTSPAESEPVDVRPNAYESLAWKETITRLQAEMDKLPEREQVILRRHYIEALTFSQIGHLLALSKGRVSQIHREALMTLRKRLGRPSAFQLLG